MVDFAWILYSPGKGWLLLQFFSHLWLSKSLLPRQLFALKIRSLIISCVSFLFIKLDWNQAAGSPVIGGRDSKSHRQTDYVRSAYIRKKSKIKKFPIWQLKLQPFCDLSAFFPLVFTPHKFAGLSPPILCFPVATLSPCSCSYFSIGNVLLILPSLKVCISAELLLLWGYNLENKATGIALKWEACLNTSSAFSRNTFPSPLRYIHLVLLIVHLYSKQFSRRTHFH